MELLILGGLVGGFCWLIRHLPIRQPTSAPSPQELARRAAIARQQHQQIMQRRHEQQVGDRRRRLAAHNMQVVILQIGESPDFRRAASHAELARDVPLAFRQIASRNN